MLAGLAALVAVLFTLSTLIGPSSISAPQALGALLFDDGATSLVMREIRLPRAVLGLLIGAALGASGAALQGYLGNPLAEPGLIGVSGSAALGAVIAIQTGFAASYALALPLAGLAGAVVGVAVMLYLAGASRGSLTLILAGVAVSAFAAAAMSLTLSLSPNPYAMAEITFWMMGSLADRSWLHVWLAAPVMAAGAVALIGTGRGLDALTLGEDSAASLGIDLGVLRLRVVLGVAAMVGAATSVAGAIGFVGLVVPHLLRKSVGARPGRLIAACALGGAARVLATDIAVRVLLPGRDLKLGVVMALIGAPVFLQMIWRQRQQGWS